MQSYKETPAVDNADEETLEVNSVDPALREIDAELENSLMDDAENGVVMEDDTPDASENEE